MRFSLLATLLLTSGTLFGQDVPPLSVEGNTVVVKVQKLIPITVDQTVVVKFPTFVNTDPEIGFYFWSYPANVKAIDKGNVLQIDSAPKGEVRIDLKVQSGVISEGKIKYVTKFNSITLVVGVPEPPVPPDPPKPDPKPEPKPVSSFRVILVYESGKTPTASQVGTMDSKIVRDYLTANTTPEAGLAGWRKYDKDQDSSRDAPTLHKMWQATRPSLTAVPCVAIEVNGHVDIVPLEATPQAMVDVFKRYKGGL